MNETEYMNTKNLVRIRMATSILNQVVSEYSGIDRDEFAAVIDALYQFAEMAGSNLEIREVGQVLDHERS